MADRIIFWVKTVDNDDGTEDVFTVNYKAGQRSVKVPRHNLERLLHDAGYTPVKEDQ